MRFEAIKKEKMQCCNGFLRGKKKDKRERQSKNRICVIMFVFLKYYFQC
jgi:hypothetical protein